MMDRGGKLMAQSLTAVTGATATAPPDTVVARPPRPLGTPGPRPRAPAPGALALPCARL